MTNIGAITVRVKKLVLWDDVLLGISFTLVQDGVVILEKHDGSLEQQFGWLNIKMRNWILDGIAFEVIQW